ncbi:hypothetical protein ACLMJK_009680 [Lecanora helva]
MGRPRKRRREEVESTDINVATFDGISSNPWIPEGTNGGLQNLNFLPLQTSPANYDGAFSGLGNVATEFTPRDNEFQSPQLPHYNLTVPLPSFEYSHNSTSAMPQDLLDPNLIQSPSMLDNITTTNTVSPDTTQTGCSCLTALYAILSTFQSPPPPSFPYSMGSLRSARKCAFSVVRCQQCPGAYNTAVQNCMLLCALLQMLINEYAKLLKHIDERSASGERIAFRVGEPSSPLDERHTGGPDCPMAITLDLSGDEWRVLARKGVRQELCGSSDSDESLRKVLQEMRDRQERWHNNFPRDGHDHGDGSWREKMDREGKEKSECICTQILHIDHLRRGLEALDI